MKTTGTGLTYVALGVAGLLAIATVVVVALGILQWKALDAAHDAQADLGEQLDAHQPDPSARPQPVDPLQEEAPSPPPVALPDSQPASVIEVTNSDEAVDPIWALSGDPATDDELMAMAANRCAGEGYVYDEMGLSVSKLVAMNRLKQRFYAQQTYLERQSASDPDEIPKRVAQLRRHLEEEQRKVLSPDEFRRWRRLEMKELHAMLKQRYESQISANAPSLSPATKEHVVSVFTEEHFDAIFRVRDSMPDEDDNIVRNIATEGETVRIVREKLTPALSPKDMEAVELVLDKMMDSIGLLGEFVGQFVDRQEQTSP